MVQFEVYLVQPLGQKAEFFNIFFTLLLLSFLSFSFAKAIWFG